MIALRRFCSRRKQQFSFTPGFSRVIGNVARTGNRLSLSLLRFTWLKPGVNETGLDRKNSVALGVRMIIGQFCYAVTDVFLFR